MKRIELSNNSSEQDFFSLIFGEYDTLIGLIVRCCKLHFVKCIIFVATAYYRSVLNPEKTSADFESGASLRTGKILSAGGVS